LKEAELGEVARIETGTTPSTKNPEYHDGNIPFIKPGDLDNQPKIIFEAESYVTDLGAEQGRIIPKNGVMVCCIGSLGKLAVAGRDMVTNQQINSVIFDEEKVFPKFGAYFLSTQKKELEHLASSTTVAIVNKTNFSKLKIPLPSLSEQKAIVAKLDRAQRLIDIDREMLAKYDELIQSVFLEMFGDPVRNAKGWERKVFSKVFDITTGKLNANAAVEDGKYPFFTCSREISWIDNYAFDTEALLLAGNNASGDFNIKYYNGKFNAYQRTYVLTSEENYGFLKIALDYFLNQMKSDSIGTNTKYLTLTLLDRMKIPIPPIDLQNKFNDIITKIDEEKRIVNQQQIKKSEELFSSLVQGVFG